MDKHQADAAPSHEYDSNCLGLAVLREAELQVIMATNRIESLDPALIRPGRIDRKIEFPLPDTKTKRRIFGIHTSKMTLAPDVNLEEFIMAKVSRASECAWLVLLLSGDIVHGANADGSCALPRVCVSASIAECCQGSNALLGCRQARPGLSWDQECCVN